MCSAESMNKQAAGARESDRVSVAKRVAIAFYSVRQVRSGLPQFRKAVTRRYVEKHLLAGHLRSRPMKKKNLIAPYFITSKPVNTSISSRSSPSASKNKHTIRRNFSQIFHPLFHLLGCHLMPADCPSLSGKPQAQWFLVHFAIISDLSTRINVNL